MIELVFVPEVLTSKVLHQTIRSFIIQNTDLKVQDTSNTHEFFNIVRIFANGYDSHSRKCGSNIINHQVSLNPARISSLSIKGGRPLRTCLTCCPRLVIELYVLIRQESGNGCMVLLISRSKTTRRIFKSDLTVDLSLHCIFATIGGIFLILGGDDFTTPLVPATDVSPVMIS